MNANVIRLAQRLFKRYIFDELRLLDNIFREPHIHQLLNRFHELVILVIGIVTKHVHIEANRFLDQRLPDTTGADNSYGSSGYFITKERFIWMPRRPAILFHQSFGWIQLSRNAAHDEESKFRGGFSKNV